MPFQRKRKLSDIRELSAELEQVERRYLGHAGWKTTSETPGSLVLWTRDYEGSTIMVTKDTAMHMQRAYFEEDPHNWVLQGSGDAKCARCGVWSEDACVPEECPPRE